MKRTELVTSGAADRVQSNPTEVKMDKEMDTATVKGKRDAARRWANYVTADETVSVTWRYLLASEADVETARGSWSALKALGDS